MADSSSAENNSTEDQEGTTSNSNENSCYVCLEKFESVSHLILHEIDIHEDAKNFKCLDCNETLTSKKSFLNHRKSHSQGHVRQSHSKGHVRQTCGEKFKIPSASHIRIHTGQRSYECEICQKSFTNRSSFNDHARIHTGERRFECQICQKRFTHKSSLNDHARIHTGERRYECQICHMRFTHRSSFNDHARIHSGERPYKCNECGKSFIQLQHLKAHNRRHDYSNVMV